MHAHTALQYADMAGLEQSTALAYSTASQRLFNTFFDKFRLLDHLKALKNYLMLGKGDFVEILIENLGSGHFSLSLTSFFSIDVVCFSLVQSFTGQAGQHSVST